MQEYNGIIEADTSKGVLSVTVKLVASDFTGDVNVTDLMLQGGSIVTLWSGHPSEIKWSVDK